MGSIYDERIRTCICCRRPFKSQSAANRKCGRCKKGHPSHNLGIYADAVSSAELAWHRVNAFPDQVFGETPLKDTENDTELDTGDGIEEDTTQTALLDLLDDPLIQVRETRKNTPPQLIIPRCLLDSGFESALD